MHQPLQHFDFVFTFCSYTCNEKPIEYFKPHFNRCRLVNSVTISFCFCANKNVTTKSQLSPEQDNQNFVHIYVVYLDGKKAKKVQLILLRFVVTICCRGFLRLSISQPLPQPPQPQPQCFFPNYQLTKENLSPKTDNICIDCLYQQLQSMKGAKKCFQLR